MSTYPVFDKWLVHPGRKLNVGKIINAYTLAEEGYPQDQIDIFDDRIEADAHLRGLLERRADGVARKPWIIQPGGDSPEDKEAADALDAAIRRVPNWAETLSAQARYTWYGWSASEIDWQLRDGLIVPVWFENPLWRRFRFDDQDYPHLATEGESFGIPLTPGKWWITRKAGRLYATSGLMRTALWWSHFKTIGIRDWIVFANRFGIPYVTGRYDPSSTNDEEKAILRRALKSLGSEGWAMFSNFAEIVIHEVRKGGGSEDVHGVLTARCDIENSKLIAGATLTSETQGPGSFALGKVHQDQWYDLLDGDAEDLALSFQRSIGAPFVHYNGLKAKPPTLKIHVVRNMGPVEWGEIFDLARNKLGMALDAEQVRRALHLKTPTGAEVVEPPTPKSPSDG